MVDRDALCLISLMSYKLNQLQHCMKKKIYIYILLCTSFRYLFITCNAFIACYNYVYEILTSYKLTINVSVTYKE